MAANAANGEKFRTAELFAVRCISAIYRCREEERKRMTNPTKSAPQPRPRRKGPHDPLDPHSEIVRRLRALYVEVEREPIPAGLIALLEKLDEAEARGRA
jgi:Anti-sigma factor NepR